jgi:hypothetical protein
LQISNWLKNRRYRSKQVAKEEVEEGEDVEMEDEE